MKTSCYTINNPLFRAFVTTKWTFTRFLEISKQTKQKNCYENGLIICVTFNYAAYSPRFPLTIILRKSSTFHISYVFVSRVFNLEIFHSFARKKRKKEKERKKNGNFRDNENRNLQSKKIQFFTHIHTRAHTSFSMCSMFQYMYESKNLEEFLQLYFIAPLHERIFTRTRLRGGETRLKHYVGHEYHGSKLSMIIQVLER